MVNDSHAAKYIHGMDVETHMKQFYAGLCSGTVTDFSSRKWAIKAGGALTRLVPDRAAHPQQYPSELFHDDIFIMIYGMPTAQAGAMVEERAINTEGCNQVNKRQAVSDYEHLGADRELLGSALYVKVVRACVVDSKVEFQAAWNAHKLANPELYKCTLKQNGMDKYSCGTDAYSLQTDAFSCGMDAFSRGMD